MPSDHPGDVQQILDELYESEATGGDSHAQLVALECLCLLCGAGAGGQLVDSLVGGKALLERLALLLQRELRAHKVRFRGVATTASDGCPERLPEVEAPVGSCALLPIFTLFLVYGPAFLALRTDRRTPRAVPS